MDIFQIVSLGIVAAVLSLTIKKDSPVFGIFIGIAASLLIFFNLMPELSAVLGLANDIARHIDTNIPFLSPVLKILGIAYISEFAAQILTDAGEGAIAAKVELAGKILIMTVSAPIVLALVNQVLYLLPS